MVKREAPNLRAIYESELRYVWNTLRRLGVAERHVPDVAQDVFLVVHAKLETYDTNRAIRPWLFGIAFRTASDHRRRAHITREVFDAAAEGIDHAPNAEAQLVQRERRTLVHRALDELDLELRAVFVMIDIDGASAPEASEALAIPVNTVYSRLRRARARFEASVKKLSPRGTP
ncbi:sigma-70 family RNA polymerase sigma factor [Myxococcota bacterium]|nr:sigma-70 family RNA polymerase sigma factor [Myxococcota bacterium]